MAKYTELLAQYLLNGNTLPAIFSQIEGFEELFKTYYLDKEIGFETEELFKIKLEMYANIYIPLYKKRIDKEAEAFTNTLQPTKIFYDKGTNIYNMGKTRGRTSDLPLNDDGSIIPSAISENDAVVNNTDTNDQHIESGLTISEAMQILDELNKKVKSITLNLLEEFNKCFMGVY